MDVQIKHTQGCLLQNSKSIYVLIAELKFLDSIFLVDPPKLS